MKINSIRNSKTFILGAGITGLCAGLKTGYKIFESKKAPGGLCLSYYIKPHGKMRLSAQPGDYNAYRFEVGGGHWIFGADKNILRFLGKFCTLKKYIRRSAIYFSKQNLYVPYPLQNNLRYLPEEIKQKALKEILNKPDAKPNTLKDWLQLNFGKTLCGLFFFPFHEVYTAGLFKKISPQDFFKTPADVSRVLKGAQVQVGQVGYNTEFVYPEEGLNILTKNIAGQCNISYQKEAVRIDTKNRIIYFKDKTSVCYDKLISTLPLNEMVKMADIKIKEKADPYTSVLALNLGAVKGRRCPGEHWLYIPDSISGFHRVGFYSNVDVSFLPKPFRKDERHTGIYVERAYANGKKPSISTIRNYISSVIKELQGWGFIEKVEVADAVWIDVAYTWLRPGSEWRKIAINALKKHNIHQIGRYGRWKFQGVAESVKEGLVCKG